MPDMLAHAKINLTLSVHEKRADGLHPLSSLVAFLDLADRLEITPASTLASAAPKATLILRGEFAHSLQDLPPEENLVRRALDFMGVDAAITLTKNIPVQAGLGGGSADVGAVLRALDHRSAPEKLIALGSDVPACYLSQPLWLEGVGEKLSLLPPLPPLWCVLVKPALVLSTKEMFALWDKEGVTTAHAPPPAFNDAAEVFAFCRAHANDLERVARAHFPQLSEVLAALEQTGAGFSRMSGSGSCCFGLYARAAAASAAAATMQRHPHLWVATAGVRSR